jgi:ankyrin repeat protein
MVALLLKQGADVEALSREEKWSPLMLASFNAYPAVARQLLDAGAKVNASNKLGQTALSVAVHGAWLRSDWDEKEKRAQATLDTIQLLIDRRANVNVNTWDNQTPLAMARESRLRKIAALLRQAGGK